MWWTDIHTHEILKLRVRTKPLNVQELDKEGGCGVLGNRPSQRAFYCSPKTLSKLGEEQDQLAYMSRSQAIAEGIQGRHRGEKRLKGLLTLTCSDIWPRITHP